ncbi:hypothetical protein BZARG_798 [Bizionia argentinensis JUB59]|uniref:Uncharacterized protein n=1 Tax=Bizionia argentinensis JUB59 TaxID=1046627 RepID=G2EBB5_9FLAO|nr:pyocin knob domain-containing protein [Bizionia argentinensis]EGV44336.1 hypothetical protein BZARG_798 [Bizionia argentinensis JUB59]
MANLSTIKNWFKTGLKPTQAQFWATWDSFRHKDDAIPLASIDGLEDDLDGKVDKISGFGLSEENFTALEALQIQSNKSDILNKQDNADKGQVNGYASLDASGKVPSSELPSYVDDVLEFDDLISFPVTGDSGKIYIAIDTGKSYRWSGTSFIQLMDIEVLDENDLVSNSATAVPTQSSVKTYVDNFSNAKNVNTYANIPLKEGTYNFWHNIDANFANLDTNFFAHDDVTVETRLKFIEVVGDWFYPVDYITVIRSKFYRTISPEKIVFKDDIYIKDGKHLGYVIDDKYESKKIFYFSEAYIDYVFYNVGKGLEAKNCYNKSENKYAFQGDAPDIVSTSYLRYSTSDLITFNGENTLIFPSKFFKDIEILHSEIFVGERKLSNYSIGQLSDESDKSLIVTDNSGVLSNILITGEVKVKIVYIKDVIGLNKLTPLSINTGVNALNYESINTAHSTKMSNWFKQLYLGFPGVVYDASSVPMQKLSESKAVFNREVLVNNIGIVFSAARSTSNRITDLYQTSNEHLINVGPLGNNTLVRRDVTVSIDKFVNSCIVVTSRAETDNDGTDPLGTSYGFGVEFNEPTRQADLTAIGLTPDVDSHQQSPAVAIVAAKLKMIKDATSAPWDIIRQACRLTASNANNYNVYRGFGQIDTTAAIAMIPSMLAARSLELAEYFESTSRFPALLKYEDKGENTEVVKRDLEQVFNNSARRYSLNGATNWNNLKDSGLYSINNQADDIGAPWTGSYSSHLLVNSGFGIISQMAFKGQTNSSIIKHRVSTDNGDSFSAWVELWHSGIEEITLMDTTLLDTKTGLTVLSQNKVGGGNIYIRPNGRVNTANQLVLKPFVLDYNGDMLVGGKITGKSLKCTNIPTSASGLSSGDIWSDGGTLKII